MAKNKNGTYTYEEPCGSYIVMGMLFGILLLLFIQLMIGTFDVRINKVTMNEICQKLNTNTTLENININAYADRNGKLICEYPSYDNSQNIVFTSNIPKDRA